MNSILYTQDIRQENLQLAQKIARHSPTVPSRLVRKLK
jgi:hypothetical protein